MKSMKLVRYKNKVIRLDMVESFEIISLLKLSEYLEIYLRFSGHRDYWDILIGEYKVKKSNRIKDKMFRIEEFYLESLIKFLESESSKFDTEDMVEETKRIIKEK